MEKNNQKGLNFYTEMLEANFTLKDYISMIGREHDLEKHTVEKDDIPEVLSYLYHFSDRFRQKDVYAVYEWRLLLCEIFFGRLFSSEPNFCTVVKKKFAYQDESTLTTLIFEELIKKNHISGIDENTDSFRIYKTVSVGYAMILPEVVLMPFANYDKSAFRLSRFAEGGKISPKNGYRSVVSYFKNNLNQLRFFLDFLSELREASVDRSIAFTALNDYIEDLKADFLIDDSLYLKSDCGDVSLEQALDHDFLYRLTREFNNSDVAEMFSSNPFKNKALCFMGKNAKMDNEGFVLADTALGRYRFDYGGQKLTPIPVRGFLGEDISKALYVVPPVSDMFYDCMIREKIKFFDWNVSVAPENSCVDIKITFGIGEMLFTEQRSFGIENIVVARNLPYIAMWPHVPVEWNEYFVYSLHKRFEEDETDISFPIIESDERIRFVDIGDVEVSIPVGGTKYECHTVGITDEKFTVIQSRAFPDAIELKVGGESFGYWMIVRDFRTKMYPVQEGRKGKIGFDFATTASVVKLSIDKKIISVDGPGEYLYDVFNPNYGTVRKTDLWETIHNYTMLGNVSGAVSKIYTYGQNYNAYRSTELLKSTRHNITGRAVFASAGYILHSIVSDDLADTSMIYGNLKWPEDSGASRVSTAKDEARDNFILSVLAWGVLKAKLFGCDEVEINVSYPQIKIGGSVLVSVNRIKDQLEQMSGFDEIKIFSCREAQANAAYLIEGNMNGYHSFSLPNPENGFMIVDIGGGTTDVAVCQYENLKVPFEEKVKGEISFKYAGREIIDIPLIMNEHVSKMWRPTTEIDVEEILRNFNWKYIVDTRKPLSDQISRMISAVGFILDNSELKNEYMINMTEKSRQTIKYKYIGLFWLLGRYIAKLEEENKIKITGSGPFNIYLTGSASNGIYGLCMIDDPDFVDKCGKAACASYSLGKDKKADFIRLAHDKDYGKKTNIKEAVAAGLLFLDFTQEDSSEEVVSNYLDFFEKKDKEEKNKVEFTDFNSDCVISLLKNLFEVLSLVNEETYSLADLDREDIDIIYECLNGKNEETDILYRNFIYGKIGDSPVSNDFMALYLLEVFLDLRRSLYPKSKEESITRNISGEFTTNVCVKDDNMYTALEIPLCFKYETEYKIYYPDKFKIDYGEGVKTAPHLTEIEEKYKEAINGFIVDALKKFGEGISYSLLADKTLDITEILESKLNNSIFSDAGFINVGLKVSVLDISEEDHARVLTEKQKFLAVLMKGLYEKKKADCKSYGIIKRNITVEIVMNVPVKAIFDGVRAVNKFPQEMQFEISYEIDDTDHYYSYRGTKFTENYTDNSIEREFVEEAKHAAIKAFSAMWQDGIDKNTFAVNYTDRSAAVQIDGEKIFSDVDVFIESIRQSLDVHGVVLTGFRLVGSIKASEILYDALFKSKEQDIIQEAADYVKEHEFSKKARLKAIEMLEAYPYFPGCVDMIKVYQDAIAEDDRDEAEYRRACALAKSRYNRFRLNKAEQIFRNMLWYKDSIELSVDCSLRIDKIVKVEQKIKKATAVLIVLSILALILFGIAAGIRKINEFLHTSGNDSSWSYSKETATLTIEGAGDVEATLRNRAAFAIKKKKVENIIIEDGITSLYEGIFKNYENLNKISLPKTLEDIDQNAFNNCDKLTSVKVPASVKNIGEYAFYDCNKLKKVSIPESVKRIESNAFASCKSLQDVSIHKNEVVIALDAFADCPKVTFTSNEEKEYNNTIFTSNEISVNKVYTGNLSAKYNMETDWYVLNVKKKIKKAVLVVYTEKQTDNARYWDVSLKPYVCRFYRPGAVWAKYIKGKTTMTVSDTFTLNEGLYYIQIESSDAYSDAPYSFYIKDLSS